MTLSYHHSKESERASERDPHEHSQEYSKVDLFTRHPFIWSKRKISTKLFNVIVNLFMIKPDEYHKQFKWQCQQWNCETIQSDVGVNLSQTIWLIDENGSNPSQFSL